VVTVKRKAGVLCTRVRLEEKRLIAALGALGVDGQPLPPTDSPLPVLPLSRDQAASDHASDSVAVVIDRLRERQMASVWLPYWRQPGREIIDAGVAATLDRLAIARILAEAGMPRPETALVISEASGLNAVDLFEGSGTLLPLQTGSQELPLLDRESAEAVLEHRGILGEPPDAISVMQQGVAGAGNRAMVITVDGVAVAVDGSVGEGASLGRVAGLAEETARLLGARLIGVVVARIDDRLVIWDVDPVPEFRSAKPIADVSVASAVATLAGTLLGMTQFERVEVQYQAEAEGHVFLSA
jgi:hypothetical protein